MALGYHHLGIEDLFEIARKTPLRLARDRFVFVRHGETDGNAKKIFQFAEQPLNANGLAQAHSASSALKGHRLARIRASTMSRAWRTAEIIGEPHAITPEPSDDLRERWFGDLVGTPAGGYDWRLDPPRGETMAYFVERTQRGLAGALAGREETAVVAHGGTLYVLAPSLGLDLDMSYYANASPLLFEHNAAGWKVTRLADTGGKAGNIT